MRGGTCLVTCSSMWVTWSKMRRKDSSVLLLVVQCAYQLRSHWPSMDWGSMTPYGTHLQHLQVRAKYILSSVSLNGRHEVRRHDLIVQGYTQKCAHVAQTSWSQQVWLTANTKVKLHLPAKDAAHVNISLVTYLLYLYPSFFIYCCCIVTWPTVLLYLSVVFWVVYCTTWDALRYSLFWSGLISSF